MILFLSSVCLQNIFAFYFYLWKNNWLKALAVSSFLVPLLSPPLALPPSSILESSDLATGVNNQQWRLWLLDLAPHLIYHSQFYLYLWKWSTPMSIKSQPTHLPQETFCFIYYCWCCYFYLYLIILPLHLSRFVECWSKGRRRIKMAGVNRLLDRQTEVELDCSVSLCRALYTETQTSVYT